MTHLVRTLDLVSVDINSCTVFPTFTSITVRGLNISAFAIRGFVLGVFLFILYVSVLTVLLESKCADVDSCSDVCSHTAATYIQISVS